MWWRARKNHQLLWCLYGLDSDQPLFVGEWPEERVHPDDASPRLYPITAYAVRNTFVDHFSWHQDGTVLLKSADDTPVYSHKERLLTPLGSQAPVFLELHVQTAPVSRYRKIDAQRCAATIVAGPHDGVAMYIAVSGRDYDMSGYLKESAEDKWAGASVLHVGAYAIGLLHRSISRSTQPFPGPDDATLVGLRFLLETGPYRHKTFLFR